MENNMVLAEIRDLLAEQNRLISQIVEMNQQSMAMQRLSMETVSVTTAQTDEVVASMHREARKTWFAFGILAFVLLVAFWRNISPLLGI